MKVGITNKLTRLAGYGSLLLNLGLIVAVGMVFSRQFRSENASTPEPNSKDNSPTLGQTAVTRAPLPTASQETSSAINLDWREIESPDYKVYMARLRAIGCPEETLHDIIVADVNKLYARKRAGIRQGEAELSYWTTEIPYERQPDYYHKLRLERAAEREKSALLRELLGFDPNEELRRASGTYDYLEWQYDFLPAGKRELARDIQEKYLDLQRERYPANRSHPEVRRALRALFQERLAELATILTPQELEEYNLRSSHAAEALRNLLDGFEPTQSEFKDIFYLRQKRDANLTLLDSRDQDAVARFRQASAETDAEMQQLLGDNRFARYQRAQDPAYKQLHRLVKARDLPSDTAERVYEIKAAMDNAVRVVHGDPDLLPEQRSAALAGIKADASAGLIRLLGEKNLALYRIHGGLWTHSLPQ